MSQNLDLVRSIYAGWERGDFSSAKHDISNGRVARLVIYADRQPALADLGLAPEEFVDEPKQTTPAGQEPSTYSAMSRC